MCGIAGIAAKQGGQGLDLKKTVFDMSRSMAHRGPDGEGFVFFSNDRAQPVFSDHTPAVNKESSRFAFNPLHSISQSIEPGFAMAHRRLSIIDLSEAGHQPMCNEAGDLWITFNGEIYNYIELREILEAEGYVFRTHTDTEVIIHAYRHWGASCLQLFNGMWAFAMYDASLRQLFCARDRVGVKPFYYVNNAQAFAFASEHKAFIKSGLIQFEIDEANQFDFLTGAKLEHNQRSLFAQVTELLPGCFLQYKLESGELVAERYDTLQINELEIEDEQKLIYLVREALLDATRVRLRSDVEVGSCLSGGIDSSMIAGMVKHLQPRSTLKLFTSVFEGESFDEKKYAALVAESVGGEWHTVSPTAADFYRDIEKLNYYQDLPIWSTSTYSQYRVMQLAGQNHIKVVLDGQGADELFSGYTHHYLSYWKELAGGLQIQKLRHEMASSKDTLPDPFSTLVKQYAKDLFRPSASYKPYLPASHASSKPGKIYSGLNNQLAHDYAGGRLKSYLKCEDRSSMAFGIESRVPFADDIDLVRFLFSIPAAYKIRNGTLKYLLREVAKEFIPPVIYQRKDKVGFETPQVKWLQHGKAEVIDTIAAGLDVVNADALRKDFDQLVTTKPYFVLRLYSFAVWKHVFSTLSFEP